MLWKTVTIVFSCVLPLVLAQNTNTSEGALLIIPSRLDFVSKTPQFSDEFEVATNPLAVLSMRHVFPRQGGCISGYATCRGYTSCCPVGGECCVSSVLGEVVGCCPSGQFCYGSGCCPDGREGCGGVGCCFEGDECCGSRCCGSGSTCQVARDSGESVCCPAGRRCVTDCPSGQVGCTTSPFSDYGVCCPPGVGCVDNSAGIPVCDIPIPTATRTIATTQPTTTRTSTTLSTTTAIISTAAVTTTVTSLRGPTTTISAGGSLPPTPNFTQSFPPEPTSSSPYRNVTIAADDQSIVYSNGFWETSTACEGSAKKTSVIGGQMDCQFVGTAIYISTLVGPSGGVYTVTIDGQSVDVSTFEFEMRDGISTEVAAREKCEVTWSAWGLADRVHTVRLVYRGVATGPNVAVGNSREVPSVGITRFTVTTSGQGSPAENPPPVPSSKGTRLSVPSFMVRGSEEYLNVLVTWLAIVWSMWGMV